MIDERFSAASFEELGLDTESAGELAEELAEEILADLHSLILPHVMKVVRSLNEMGHKLEFYDPPVPGEIAFRDQGEGETEGRCRLRIAVDTIISTGYAHLGNPEIYPESEDPDSEGGA